MIILGIDLGKARTGVAICDKGELLASPLTVVTEYHREQLVEKLSALAKENKAELLAMGLPRNMDGSEGESAQNAREIGALLEEATGLPVEFVDERGTTITAHGYLNETNTRGKKRKAVVDAVAATVILEDCLRRRRNQRQG
ncbi:MAG TPA: Holliday junction resolvase RuvX [Candidatus Flavonifractor intestinigallinarum]|uniref:Putative pre-16S rRNA nuclease n=1 Tax=Candidatus Flavonifractor intestinigallinarum TaxID=2838586 RepID=A0A9D2MKK6_9FIRM|nr:Holliday junction resolvase RuvX [Candidatus Flavonifractor intestinigallinarum]